MSVSARGQLHDSEQRPLANLTVVTRDVFAPIPHDLGSGTSAVDGQFSLTYQAGGQTGFGSRVLEFRVLDRAHRVLLRFQRDDPLDAVLDLGDLVIPTGIVAGWAVTLGPGQTAQPIREKNAVKLLIDNAEAWQRIAEEFKAATKTLHFMQLDFLLPPDHKTRAIDELPNLVLQFDPAEPLTPDNRRKVGDDEHNDDRPEWLMLDAARRAQPVDVRLLINRLVLDSHAIGAAALIPGFGVLLILGGLIGQLAGTDWAGSYNEVKGYFESDPLFKDKKKVLGATTSPFARTHAKMAIADGTTAIGIASPFDQGYFGDAAHAIDDPRRGASDGVPHHDVSFAVAGPAVADLHETYRLHWNTEADENNKVNSIQPQAAPAQLDKFDGYATIQVIRTLDTGRFTEPGEPAGGEKGILEAYLRAIGNAESLIYLENQYFTNDQIGTALRQALTDAHRPKLNVIMVLNISPDIPFYPSTQNDLIARIRKGLTDEQQRRFGVFTTWTHEVTPKPRIAANYVHSKVGIVDDKWATLGSANLDGSSLDYTELLHALAWGDVRNTEVNIVMFNGITQPGIQTPLVDLLRRRLWAEHLGAAGENDPILTPARMPGTGWAQLWHDKATGKLNALKANPAALTKARILPWPVAKSALDTPRAHLAALLGKPEKDIGLDPIKKTQAYSFKEGEWLTTAPTLD